MVSPNGFATPLFFILPIRQETYPTSCLPHRRSHRRQRKLSFRPGQFPVPMKAPYASAWKEFQPAGIKIFSCWRTLIGITRTATGPYCAATWMRQSKNRRESCALAIGSAPCRGNTILAILRQTCALNIRALTIWISWLARRQSSYSPTNRT